MSAAGTESDRWSGSMVGLRPRSERSGARPHRSRATDSTEGRPARTPKFRLTGSRSDRTSSRVRGPRPIGSWQTSQRAPGSCPSAEASRPSSLLQTKPDGDDGESILPFGGGRALRSGTSLDPAESPTTEAVGTTRDGSRRFEGQEGILAGCARMPGCHSIAEQPERSRHRDKNFLARLSCASGRARPVSPSAGGSSTPASQPRCSVPAGMPHLRRGCAPPQQDRLVARARAVEPTSASSMRSARRSACSRGSSPTRRRTSSTRSCATSR